ncbi:hypothetical protein PsorP6_002224 [Peronosclerospora sorghi]|uniref:Uncharacterized protein n=1 Tax=Peronosclerospora sorghi TaxID=230839 RepID=A0ACC0WU02_9STRA|nr:hypothetical protein PsorP6_002224 [Peronosclerospora sorghi]
MAMFMTSDGRRQRRILFFHDDGDDAKKCAEFLSEEGSLQLNPLQLLETHQHAHVAAFNQLNTSASRKQPNVLRLLSASFMVFLFGYLSRIVRHQSRLHKPDEKEKRRSGSAVVAQLTSATSPSLNPELIVLQFLDRTRHLKNRRDQTCSPRLYYPLQSVSAPWLYDDKTVPTFFRSLQP